MVALTTGVVACGLAGDGGGLLQAGLSNGIFPHELGPEGGTGPLAALCGWTLRRKTSAMTVKTTLRNLMIVLVVRQTC